MDAEAVRLRLREAVDDAGSITKWSHDNMLPASVVSDILNHRRDPTPQVLRAMGLVLVRDYQPTEGGKSE